MFRQIVAFELGYQLRQPLLWATAAIFAALSFIATISDGFAIGGAIGNLNRNAPFVVMRMLGDMSLIGAFIVVAFAATSAIRDFERGTDDLVFSRPVHPTALLFGRFVGSMAAVWLCFGCAAIGLFIGSWMPWLDPERVGPRDPRIYLYGLALLAWPTLTIIGAILFALATRVRRIAIVYVSLVALLVAFFTSSAMFGDLESRPGAALLDPFGLTAFDLQTRYWTIVERNSRLPAFSGELLWNRVAWMAAALAILSWAIVTFRYEPAVSPRKKRGLAAPAPLVPVPVRRVRVRAAFGRGTRLAQLVRQWRLDTRAVIGGLPFLLIVAFGLINVLGNIGYLDLMMGTPVWPVTHLMLVAIGAGYSFLLNIILTFYAGELVWRERSMRLDGVFDALPAPTWTRVVAKLGALWAAVVVFFAAGAIALIGFQLSQGYTRIEPWLYAQGLLVASLPFFLSAVLALFFQVVANQKFVGYLLMVLYLVASAMAGPLHLNHYLYRFAQTPSAPYSDMNGWGHFVAPLVWFNVYWAFAAGVLACLAHACWVRGYESRWRQRLQTARARLRGSAALLALFLLGGFVVTGAFIFYNTNILNSYASTDDAERRYADYEKRYRRYRDVEQPRIVSVRTNVDIYPRERRAEIRGTYRLSNRSASAIDTLHIFIPPRLRVVKLVLPAHQVLVEDRRLGHGIYKLASPLQPGRDLDFGFHLEIVNPGFVNNDPDNTVVENGTFFHTRQLPALGYQDYRELGDLVRRRRQGLPPLARKAPIDDQRARQINNLARDADWVDFDSTISTDQDQIALAPGRLEREWHEGGRRFFHYKAEGAIPKLFAFLSARYAVRRDSWRGVAIEILYHPGHEYNVGRMVDAVKKTLQYMTDNFAPYQDREVRIAEFPRYARIAGSFPSIIPMSESIGFIAHLKDRDAIDYPFYVTAHEMAHRWWGYQVLGADVQGSGMLSESMAQYSALMVMKHEYGGEQMRRFLRYELDRYLSGRGDELVEEVPLELVEDQPYIYYSKGSLALYALQDALGEQRLNAALRQYIASVRFQPPPYTITRDLLGFIAGITPPESRGLVNDLFGSIVLFDNRTTTAESKARPDGRYEVTLTARARKLRADGQGVEKEVALDDWIDVGIFGEASTVGGGRREKVLYLQKQHVTGQDVRLTAIVDSVPVRAGIDPYNMLVDRTPGDNVRDVTAR
jgi:ABC-2 type transport system permease protein